MIDHDGGAVELLETTDVGDWFATGASLDSCGVRLRLRRAEQRLRVCCQRAAVDLQEVRQQDFGTSRTSASRRAVSVAASRRRVVAQATASPSVRGAVSWTDAWDTTARPAG